jgi:hypothetical protein
MRKTIKAGSGGPAFRSVYLRRMSSVLSRLLAVGAGPPPRRPDPPPKRRRRGDLVSPDGPCDLLLAEADGLPDKALGVPGGRRLDAMDGCGCIVGDHALRNRLQRCTAGIGDLAVDVNLELGHRTPPIRLLAKRAYARAGEQSRLS